MTDRTQLHHLADRARRGVLLPEEGALLADAVAELDRRIDTLEAVCKSNKRAYKGAVQTAWEYEAAIARVRAELALCDWPHAEVRADRIRAALDAVPDPGTVTITQDRHQHLLAGQCIHHQDTHRLHHGEPVTGCPYKGCHDRQAGERKKAAGETADSL